MNKAAAEETGFFVYPESAAKVTGNTINPGESDRHKAIF